MSLSLTRKTVILNMTLLAVSFATSLSYADKLLPIPDSSTQNLVAGFGSKAIEAHLMNKAPTGSEITIATDMSQATYLLSPNSPLVGPLTQQLLSQIAHLGTDKDNDTLSFTWNPNAKSDQKLAAEPLKSVDINSVLQPLAYNAVQEAQAKNVIDALGGTLTSLNTVNFAQLIANLSGDKTTNLKTKLNEKQIQDYLAALRSYIATQTIALGNLYQLYAERQAIDPATLSPDLRAALKSVANQTKGPVSALQLENFMATRRIIDKNWHIGLLQDNPASLQREQIELLAENLAENYQARMTAERLLATMSVLVLELNQQIRTQIQSQVQTITNPTEKTG
jgi:hypothetical protein